MLIIAFGHKKHVGKDTAAKLMFAEFATNTINYNIPNSHKTQMIAKKGFSDKLKDVAHTIYSWAGLKPKEYYDIHPEQKEQLLSEIGKTVRQVWIGVGMKMREIYEDTWVDNILRGTHSDILLIYDLRFPNEFDKIKSMGGYCIKINRNNIPITNDIADCALDHLPDSSWDLTINNNETIKEFQRNLVIKIKTMLETKQLKD